jgi:hypothetical protein
LLYSGFNNGNAVIFKPAKLGILLLSLKKHFKKVSKDQLIVYGRGREVASMMHLVKLVFWLYRNSKSA